MEKEMINFRDLKRQYARLKPAIDAQLAEIISSANFISGPQVRELEKQLASYVGRKHCVSCGNGTDAISIALMACGIGTGDAVFVPDFTFFSSGECPASIGATPIFVDINPNTYNMDASSLIKAIESILSEGTLKPKAVIAVDLFGLPADYDAISLICEKYHLLLLEDGAQGFGGEYKGSKACSFGKISTTSFFPAKPLGCYGDGGAIFTDDDNIAGLCRSLAVHGKNADDKYDNIRIGMNSRLDTIQAGVLLAKFPIFRDEELEAVNKAANWYTEQLKNTEGFILPVISNGYYSSWAQYAIQLPDDVSRDKVQEQLKSRNIPTMVYYKKPMHKQGAFNGTRSAVADCPVTEYVCEHIICLPIHPYLRHSEVEMISLELVDAVVNL